MAVSAVDSWFSARPAGAGRVSHALALLLASALCCLAGAARGESPTSGAARDAPSVRHARHTAPTASVHAIPGHAAAACSACHAGAETSVSAGDDLRPRPAACARCHGPAVTAPPRLPPSPPRLHFSHRAHLLRGTACETCHGGGEGGGEIRMPAMDDCLGCHRAQRSGSCAGCHRSAPDGRLRTDFGDGRPLRPRGPLMGMAHDRDWLVRHRWVGADRGEVCTTCHVERDCVACHDARRLPRAIHPGDFMALHAQDARRGAQRCQSCHTPQHFCAECHARLGLTPSAPRDLATTRRYHPPAAQWSRGPALHALEARRALTDCVTCHSESDCVACHATVPQGGGGHSPHGRGFVARCGAALAANPRACATCHGDTGELRARCR